MRKSLAALLIALAASASLAADDFRVEEVASLPDATQLQPKVVAFNDHREDTLADPATGLIRFEDWARARPLEKRLLSLYPDYIEPTVNITVHGTTKARHEKLHMYVAEARFLLLKPPSAIDLTRYASLRFLERVDPLITQRLIGPADLVPYKEGRYAPNQRPNTRWCEAAGLVVCIGSRYQLEGKLPIGIRLANKLEDSGKKIPEYMEFQSELRLVPPGEVDAAALAKLTRIDSTVSGVLEQNTFYINQIMQFAKFLAVVQPHPADGSKSIASIYMALAIKTDVLERKKEFENMPVLRNLVPAQVLVGKSSFNTGSSISAGIPAYVRNRIRTIAGLLERE